MSEAEIKEREKRTHVRFPPKNSHAPCFALVVLSMPISTSYDA